MNDTIYHQQILGLAKAWLDDAPLEGNGVIKLRHDNPLCGDSVAMAIRGDRETITSLSLQVRGCVLCKAAARKLQEQASGDRRRASLDYMCQQAYGLFAGNEVPAALSLFTPVLAHPARHECVLLPYAALAKAILMLPR